MPQTFWPYSEVGHTQDAKKELMEYVAFEHADNVLDTVKPVALIRRMLQLSTRATDGDIVLDFFAGSGPTGHAVVVQNAEDGGIGASFWFSFPSHCQSPRRHSKTSQTFARNGCGG